MYFKKLTPIFLICLYTYILILFTILFYFYITKLNFIGEVYLNYTDGFIRRGFLGQIIYFLKWRLDINLYNFSIWLNFVTKILLIFLILRIYIKKNIPTLLLLSYPLLFSGFLYSNNRVDFILLLLFITSFIILNSKLKIKNLLFFVISVIGVLIHEVYFILLITPLIILYANTKNKLNILSLFLFLSLFLVFSFVFKGTHNQALEIKKNWNELNFFPNFSYVFRDIVSQKSFYIYNIIKTEYQIFGFILNNFICILFILLSALESIKPEKFKWYLLIIITQNIVFFVLCFFACDYSRWYFLLFTSAIIFFYLFKESFISNVIIVNYNNNIFLFLKKIKNFKYLLYLIIAIPFSGWSFDSYYNSMIIFKIREIIKYLY